LSDLPSPAGTDFVKARNLFPRFGIMFDNRSGSILVALKLLLQGQ
jgi:hypothetical protein